MILKIQMPYFKCLGG